MSDPTTCPEGHVSTTTEFCDVCGRPIGARAVPEPAAAQHCAACGAEREGRFCEVCGHDSAQPTPDDGAGTRWLAPPRDAPADEPVEAVAPPPRAGEWTVVVRADRDWFDEVRRRNGPDAAGLEFPRFCPERRFVLTPPQMTIGRGSRSRGIEPEIDLSGPPLDPGVSALHALLLARPDGRWELVDMGSTNGTTLGDAARPLAPNTPVLVADGDRVKLGAWTTITFSAPATDRAQN